MVSRTSDNDLSGDQEELLKKGKTTRNALAGSYRPRTSVFNFNIEEEDEEEEYEKKK